MEPVILDFSPLNYLPDPTGRDKQPQPHFALLIPSIQNHERLEPALACLQRRARPEIIYYPFYMPSASEPSQKKAIAAEL